MEGQAVTIGQVLERNIRNRIDNVLRDGNSPRRIICRAEDYREMADDIAGWAGWTSAVTPDTFWGIPIMGLEVREGVEVWGLVILRSEDAEHVQAAYGRRGARPMIEPLGPGGCFVLAEKGQGRTG